MLEKFKEVWKTWTTTGIHWPYLFDPTLDKPSITLGMLYISALIMFGSVIASHFVDNILLSTLTTILIWVLAFVFYRMRKIDSFKLDLDDRSIEIGNNEDSEDIPAEKEENES